MFQPQQERAEHDAKKDHGQHHDAVAGDAFFVAQRAQALNAWAGLS